MNSIHMREILKILKKSEISFLICQVNGVIESCDTETKKRLSGKTRGGNIIGELVNKYVSIIYPYKGVLIPEDAFYWIQVWRIHSAKKKGESERIGILGIRIQKESKQQERVLFLLFPIKDTRNEIWRFEETELKHLLQVIEALPILVLQIDHSGKILYVNDYVKKLTGWLPSEVKNMNWFDVFIPEEIQEETIRFIKGGERVDDMAPFSFEGEVLTKDSRRLLILWACLPLYFGGDSEKTLIMLGQEITTAHRTKLFNKATQYLKNYVQWICEDLVRGIPEEDVFGDFLRNTLEIISFEAGAIFRLSERKARLITSEGLDESLLKTLREITIDNIIISEILSKKEVVEVSSLMSELKIGFQDKGFVKIYAGPVYNGDKVSGFIILASTSKDTPEAEAIPLLNMIISELSWIFLWYSVQETQRRQGRQYELLERMLPYALVSVDEMGSIMSVNRGGISLFGVENEEELLNQKIQMFIPKWEEYLQQLKPAEGFNVGEIVETDILTEKGEKIPVECVMGHFILASRSFYMVFLRDIRWRKQAIKTIQKAEEKFREIFENANDIIYTHDLNGRFTSINKAGLNTAGYTLEEILRLNIFQVVAPEYHEEVKQRIKKKLEGEPISKYELEIISKNGNRIPIEVSTRLIYEKGMPVGIQGIARDISDRRKAEEERKQLEAQILHTQKLESLGVLAGGIAHDFNNILVGILGNAELVLARLPEDSPLRIYLRRIEESAQRAGELTKQMLAYSGKGTITQKPMNLSEQAEEMAPLLSAIVSKKATIEYHLPKEVPAIQGDASQIHQVIMNLITNASEALGDVKGSIDVSVKVVDLTEEQIKKGGFLENVPAGKYVCLKVSDTGCGMTPDVLVKVFDPFFTTKFTGRGLGLATVLGIVRSHRGTIRVESELGRGTTVEVYFPVAKIITENNLAENSQLGKQGLKTSQYVGKILLVDDEESVLQVAEETISYLGFQVILARNGKEALEKVYQHKDDLKGVVLDVTMPELDGFEVFQKMNEICANIPVILCSGYSEQDISEKCSNIKPAGFLQKPYRPADLVKILKKILK
ncbi:MAG TPA: PAS domain S-box protein [Candidatus Hydrogenedens sp.]|nr:PAS domain S-box protein [Candidatus Hydrogenedens sp.]HPP58735.1 PAS domain S-box protein [Candidatus Hydrogenedens sp.]